MALSTKDYTAIDMQAANNNSLGECKFSITKSGGRFSAHFIKTYDLSPFQSMTYYRANSDPYRIVFELIKEANAKNSTSIGAEGKTGRVFNIKGLINIFPAVKKDFLFVCLLFCKHGVTSIGIKPCSRSKFRT